MKKRITCGQCLFGPNARVRKQKCSWTGQIRGKGAMACKDYFISNPSLPCQECNGLLTFAEVRNGVCFPCIMAAKRKEKINGTLLSVVGWVLAVVLALLLLFTLNGIYNLRYDASYYFPDDKNLTGEKQ